MLWLGLGPLRWYMSGGFGGASTALPDRCSRRALWSCWLLLSEQALLRPHVSTPHACPSVGAFGPLLLGMLSPSVGYPPAGWAR